MNFNIVSRQKRSLNGIRLILQSLTFNKMTAFEEFGVLREIASAVEQLGWTLPTDIQAEVIPAILGGGDVLMAAETGSGKTGAFCLPIIQIVWEVIKEAQSGKTSNISDGKGEVRWILNMFDRDSLLAIDPEGLTCQSRDQKAWQGCRATKALVNAGKYYYEAIVTDEGLCRVGWSTGEACLDLGTDRFGYGFGGTGMKSCNRNFDPYGENGFIGCAKAPSHGIGVSSTGRPKPNAPKAMVIEPTRELAEQAIEEIRRFKKHLKEPRIREVCIVGGVNSRDQIEELYRGVDIVVGTPGRLSDLVSSNNLLLDNIRFLVLDEADGLITQGHGGLIHGFHAKIPKISADGKRLQMIVCSATLHNFEVKKLADKLMHFPTWIDLKGQDSVPDTVHHVAVFVDPKADQIWRNPKRAIRTDGVHSHDNVDFSSNSPEALSEAIKLLKGEYVMSAIRKFNMDQCLIFCRTKIDCDNLEEYFHNTDRKTFTCVCLHSDKKPEDRKRNLQAFKDGQVKFLICTDVAARGVDIRGLPFCINVTLPDEATNYIHRIGRVGRADRMGLAISLVATVREKVWYHTCKNRGIGCQNTRLSAEKGCCVWYYEMQLLSDIEEHLGVTVPVVGKEMNVPTDEFDGKVVYGDKRKATGTGYKDHVSLLQATVAELADLEKRAQTSFLNMRYLQQMGKPQIFSGFQ